MTTKQRIGIMGGTFDPIHLGHLLTAETIRTACGLDKVLFIPVGKPPHKQNQKITPGLQRYVMTVMATAANPFFQVLPLELERTGLSYTIDTVRMLSAQYEPGTEFYCITGADAIKDLLTWKDVDELLDLCWFIAASRPGSQHAAESVVALLGEKGRQRIIQLQTPQLDISATVIRERLQQGLSIRYMVPDAIEEYIRKEHLYRS